MGMYSFNSNGKPLSYENFQSIIGFCGVPYVQSLATFSFVFFFNLAGFQLFNILIFVQGLEPYLPCVQDIEYCVKSSTLQKAKYYIAIWNKKRTILIYSNDIQISRKMPIWREIQLTLEDFVAAPLRLTGRRWLWPESDGSDGFDGWQRLQSVGTSKNGGWMTIIDGMFIE